MGRTHSVAVVADTCAKKLSRIHWPLQPIARENKPAPLERTNSHNNEHQRYNKPCQRHAVCALPVLLLLLAMLLLAELLLLLLLHGAPCLPQSAHLFCQSGPGLMVVARSEWWRSKWSKFASSCEGSAV